MPPFEEGLYLGEISLTHDLVFNKFSVCDCHVIVITKEFEKQLDPLNAGDFKACLAVMKSLNAYMFFNSGFNSGASVLHKHMQLIPYSSMYNEVLPVE